MGIFSNNFLLQSLFNKVYYIVIISTLSLCSITAQDYTIARTWNEELLEAIRHDLSRPTIHARNLFHTSVVMYDAWAVFDPSAEPYFLGKNVGGHFTPFEGFTPNGDIEENRDAAISFAAYRLLSHRFQHSPTADSTLMVFDLRFDSLGYDRNYKSTDYQNGDGRALGNYIAEQMILFGLQDGSNENDGYKNKYYRPVNNPKALSFRGNSKMSDLNRWQPLSLDNNRDKNGASLTNTSDFLSPEWGNVKPFSLSQKDLKKYIKDGHEYNVYHDPGPPPLLDSLVDRGIQDYQWGFMLVSQWGSHLSPLDTTVWDISPRSIGNLPLAQWPNSFREMREFYKLDGGDGSVGHSINPVTGRPYPNNNVLRGDYTRVLAEFWADGPDSETPPGHWFTILNYVSDHPDFESRYRGQGEKLDRLEWDVKSYFILGGAMHDAAISAWSVKGYYDYVRPLSAIRYMAKLGQSTDPKLPNYHKFGIPLIEGFSEIVMEGDPLTKRYNCLHDIKLFSWRGHQYVPDTKSDFAGVGWILAKDWWPYQRVDFVTPPFAGYVSGHSTFSRAAAEVMTIITGSEYFPGGMGTFEAKQNKYLKFENGPSEDIQLQWATYRDASDQCSLSRIWGGIHPPADDISGRRIGLKISEEVVEFAEQYFNAEVRKMTDLTNSKMLTAVPSSLSPKDVIKIKFKKPGIYHIELKDLNNKVFYSEKCNLRKKVKIQMPSNLHPGHYNVVLKNEDVNVCHRIQIVEG